MKRFFNYLILLILLSAFTTCERTDMFDIGEDYNSIIGWFSAYEKVNLISTNYVDSWKDRQGRNSFLYENTVLRPSFFPNAINSKYPTLRFNDAASERQLKNENLFLKPPLTIIMLTYNIGDGTLIANFSQQNTSIYYAVSPNELRITSENTEIAVPVSSLGGTAVTVLTFKFTEDSRMIIFENKTKIYDALTNQKVQFNGISIAKSYNSTNPLNGYISELILCNEAVSVDFIEKITDELLSRYGQ
ncbi:MAG: hypothetical protein JW982_04610 [Spirochaetes bacterium]|nr:hypothetical protein [Spirochaetota bacterium]